MSDHSSSRERALFDELVDLAPDAREALLRERCADDPALGARVRRLLEVAAAAERADEFLGEAHLHALDVGEDIGGVSRRLPRAFGRFRLLSVLGSGGMGVVYAAEQEHPKRAVALKVMRSEMVSRELVRRFRRETDTLARLQHVGIAQVYEAGSVVDEDSGGALVPYIAMELVPGPTLDAYVRDRGGDPRTVVRLLVAVCDAVQHAHERGVIHRDLKPANIIVVVGDADAAQPKILDFGIARLVTSDQHRTPEPAATVATSTGQILGTIAYMSPEQWGGRAASIDARTDVYAIGVILFELLTGRLPLDVRERPIADAARIVRDDEPTRLGAVDRRLRGDLETIVAKAIEKDADRRYPSAAALASDLRRFLADEPIHARPTTRIERVRRFARRHRGVVWSVTSTFVALIVGVIVAVAFAIRESDARRNAEWTSYRAGIAAASAALANHDVRSARQHLEATPEGLRGWEWRYLVGRLDQSAARASAAFVDRIPIKQTEANLTAWTVMAVGAVALPADWPAACASPRPSDGASVSSPASARLLVTDQGRRVELWSDLSKPLELLLRRRDAAGQLLSTEAVPIDGLGDARGLTLEVAATSSDGRTIAALLLRPDGTGLCWCRTAATGASATIAVRCDPGMDGALAVSDRGDVGIGAGPDGSPILWRPDSGRVTPLGDERGVRAIAFSHDGTRVATGSQGSVLCLFAIDGTLLEVERRHSEGVQSVRFSPDDSTLVTASQEGTIGLWSVTRVPAGLSLVSMLVGHTDEVQVADISADGRWIVSASHDETLRAWPIGRGELLGELIVVRSAFGQIDVDARGDTIAAANFWSVARVWDARTRTPTLLAESPAWSDEERMPAAIACSPDGSAVITVESDGVPRIRTRKGTSLEESWRGSDAMREVGYTIEGEALGLQVGEGSPVARLRRLPSNAPLTLPLPRCASPGMSSTRDGRLLAVRDMIDEEHQLFHVIDATTGALLHSVPYGLGAACALGELPDGRAVVAVAELEPGVAPGLIRDVTVRDAWTGEPIARLPGHAAHLFSIAFTPDGRRLVTGGRDGVLRVWDTERWEEVVGLEGPGGYLWALRFSPSGELLVSGGSNGIYRLWRASARS